LAQSILACLVLGMSFTCAVYAVLDLMALSKMVPFLRPNIRLIIPKIICSGAWVSLFILIALRFYMSISGIKDGLYV